MRPLRIFVPSAASLLTDRRGNGEGLIAWDLLSGLAARGHTLVVCAREADLSSAPPFELIVTGRASRFESLEPLAYARAAARLAQSRGPFDLAHWLFPTRDALFVPPARLPFVIGPHSTPWSARARRRRPRRIGDVVATLARPVYARLRRQTLDAASALLVTTDDALAQVSSGHRSKAHVIPRGVDPAKYRVTAPAAHASVLFVGKLAREKGIAELVEAFAQVRESVGDATLVVAGEGPERTHIEQRAGELGLNGSLRLLGPVPHQRVAELLRESSLLCLPSHGEPFGMVVLEAMASGRAVVATDEGGPRVLVDPTRGGRLVAPGDAKGLAGALTELLSDRRALTELGAFNRARVESEFALDQVLDAVEDVYARAIGAQR